MLAPVELLREWALIKDLARAAQFRSLAHLPRGSEPVLVIPGFGAGDAATVVLRRRLARLGHAVRGWGLGINRGRLEQDLPRLIPVFDAFHAEQGQRPVTLVGWSLGGVVARELARSRPGAVRQIIALGSPLVGGPKYTYTARSYARKGFDLDRIERKVAEREAAQPLPCPLVSVFSRRDGMVHWAASAAPGASTEAVEVDCSHLGMCVAPEVLGVIARRLA